MREIKFRAWDKEMAKVRYDMDTYTLRFLTENDNYILMQYTGLKDKNGKEIYEGDKVKGAYYDGLNEVSISGGVVKYSYGRFELVWGDNNHLWLNDIHDIEIISNIYENPELTKPKE